eukprot:sb/3462818/
MSLKQILFDEDALSKLPDLVDLLQRGCIPEGEIIQIFPALSTLLNGTLPQRKMGLSLLKCCIIYLHSRNKISEHVDVMVKWWRATVGCLKSRYSADCTFRLAAINCTLFTQIAGSYVDLLIEGRGSVPIMVTACTSHPCTETFTLLPLLVKHFPSHIGKHFDQIRGFCLSQVGDWPVEAGELLGRLPCTGPAGKNSTTYVVSWRREFGACLGGLRGVLGRVTGTQQQVSHHQGDVRKVLPDLTITGNHGDITTANNHVTFLCSALRSLLTSCSVEAPVSVPLSTVKCLIEEVALSYQESLSFISTSDNFTKRLILSHTVLEVLKFLGSLFKVLGTTTLLLQPATEQLLIPLLRSPATSLPAVTLIRTMVGVTGSSVGVPLVMLTSLLSLNQLTLTAGSGGQVTKKQRTEQFNTLTFENSTLGAHDEKLMEKVLEVVNEILTSTGPSLAQIKTEDLRGKCQGIISNSSCFSPSLVRWAHSTCLLLSTPEASLAHLTNYWSPDHTGFFASEMRTSEAHIHPQRCYITGPQQHEQTLFEGGNTQQHHRGNLREELEHMAATAVKECVIPSAPTTQEEEEEEMEMAVETPTQEEEEEEVNGSNLDLPPKPIFELPASLQQRATNLVQSGKENLSNKSGRIETGKCGITGPNVFFRRRTRE